MGWASAGGIFNPVAQALLDLGADRETKRRVLGTLISKLQDGDWDTESESLEEFKHDVDIVALFVERGVGTELWGDHGAGDLDYDPRRDVWTLTCASGDHGLLATSADGSAAEHDRLVSIWVEHDAALHDGDGEELTHMLIGDAS